MIDRDGNALASRSPDLLRCLADGPTMGESPSATLRAVTYTVMPAAPSASAIPLPAPRLAPVTTAIFSTSRILVNSAMDRI